jgi:hypothetical protein
VADDLSAALAEISDALDSADVGRWYEAGRRMLRTLEAALKFHQREPLYGNAATEEAPGNCPHHPDSPLHFEGDSEWLCEGKPEGAVCSACTEDGLPVEWPCPEYKAILAELTGKEADHDN